MSISASTLMVQEDATVRKATGCRLMDRVVQIGVAIGGLVLYHAIMIV